MQTNSITRQRLAVRGVRNGWLAAWFFVILLVVAIVIWFAASL